MDWLLFTVVVASMALSARFASSSNSSALHVNAAHEFPLVMLVAGALAWLRLAWQRTPIGRWWRRHRIHRAVVPSVVEQSRAVALVALVAANTTTTTTTTKSSTTTTTNSSGIDDNAVAAWTTRCRRVALASRARFTGSPLRTDHAHVRTALSLTGRLPSAELERFKQDAQQSLLGVPCSEPGWLRLLDATLAAFALDRLGDLDAGERWRVALHGPLALRHGHRPGSFWTLAALAGPRAAPWEHAAATGLARAAGWLDDDRDWFALRTRAFGAAARGNSIADDERLVAAGRIWLALVPDEQASRILRRVTLTHDPIAVALGAVADTLVADRHGLASASTTRT
jgi:hypothetical protein